MIILDLSLETQLIHFVILSCMCNQTKLFASATLYLTPFLNSALILTLNRQSTKPKLPTPCSGIPTPNQILYNFQRDIASIRQAVERKLNAVNQQAAKIKPKV